MRSSLPPPSRVRHIIPSWALVLLGLLFRYSHARDAWVLRGIGERRGPVLDVKRSRASEAPAGLRIRPSGQTRRAPSASLRDSSAPIGGLSPPPRLRPSEAFTERVKASRRPVITAGLLTSAVIAAGAGYAIAHHAAAVSRMAALTARTATATFTLDRPADWRRQRAPADLAALLSAPTTLAPGPGRGSLVIGLAQTPNPQLLPTPVLAGLGTVPKAQLITLGHAAFLRYENLRPKGLGSAETFYAASTTRGTLVGICRPHTRSTAFQATCERILATARVIAATPLPAGPIPSYATALTSVIRRLNAARAVLGARLAGAPNFAAQSRDAAALAAAHRAAASALSTLHAGPAGQANLEVAKALTDMAGAYDALGRAAARRATDVYRSARVTLDRLTKPLGLAFAHLQTFGYLVGGAGQIRR